MGEAEWLICSPSGVGDTHANDLGHQIVANRVFEVLAVTCSALARKALSDREKVGKSPWRHEPVSANDSRSRQVLLKADLSGTVFRVARRSAEGGLLPGTASRETTPADHCCLLYRSRGKMNQPAYFAKLVPV